MEKSESGAPIYRYKEEDKNKFEVACGGSSTDEICDHIEKHVGTIDMVFHEILSDQVHIDVHWVKPTKEKPFHTLITSGMSDKPMQSPDGVEGWDYSELCICLPEDWKVSEEDFKDDTNYWPIHWLKFLARFPHEYNTWISYGHTIPNGDPALPFAENTELNTMVLLPSLMFGQEFQSLKIDDNKTINFFSLIPLYTSEVELKLKEGVEALFDGFVEYNISDIIYIDRPNTVQ